MKCTFHPSAFLSFTVITRLFQLCPLLSLASLVSVLLLPVEWILLISLCRHYKSLQWDVISEASERTSQGVWLKKVLTCPSPALNIACKCLQSRLPHVIAKSTPVLQRTHSKTSILLLTHKSGVTEIVVCWTCAILTLCTYCSIFSTYSVNKQECQCFANTQTSNCSSICFCSDSHNSLDLACRFIQ